MAKGVKAKFELGVNTIMDSVMVPEGFGRVCDGLELRSGVARPWQLPSIFNPITDASINRIWEYRGLWFYSELDRTYHGEYIQGQQVVYFTEEGVYGTGDEALPPQKVINGTQYRLGIQRPLTAPLVAQSRSSAPTLVTATVTGGGGLQMPVASYRVAAIVDGSILTPGEAVLVTLPTVGSVVTPSTITVTWRKVSGASGYAVFGRVEGSERLLFKTGDTDTAVDNGSRGEGSETAVQYDVTKPYQYVYTYYRKIAGIEDESGPSPLSSEIYGSMTPVITRSALYDGSLTGSAPTSIEFSVNDVTASIDSTSRQVIHYFKVAAGNLSTMYATDTPHGMVTGDLGRMTIDWSGVYSDEMAITVPQPLQPPLVQLSVTNPYPTGGTVAVGAHTYKFTAVRAYTYDSGGYPPQTTETTVAVVVPDMAHQSVSFDIASFSSGTDLIIVYRDGVAFWQLDPNLATTFTDDGTDWYVSLAGYTIPTTNETSVRCFSIPANLPLNAPAFFNPPLGVFQRSLTTLTFGGTMPVGFVPTAGTTLTFAGIVAIPTLNGAVEMVSYDVLTQVMVVKKYTSYELYEGVTESTYGNILWNPQNAAYSGWRIYRVGDTAQFLLVADLPMSQTVFTDTVGTDNLGIAIPTSYEENGLFVVFDWAPRNAKRMVNHYGMRFAIVDNLVRWTPTNIPDAWPDVYFAAFPSHPVALASFKTMLMVLCQDGLYGLAGNTPSTLAVVGPLSNLGCIAPFSVQASNYGIMWLSKTGICISQDGVSAMCITADRVSGRYFYAPSQPTSIGGTQIGEDWYIPASQTTQFAESMSLEKIDITFDPVNQVTADLPINAEMLDLHSYYWNDRYHLFASGTTEHARMGIISIDMHSRGLSTGYGMTMSASGLSSASTGLPLTTLPIKPLDVHVSMGGDCYMLLKPYGVAPGATPTPPHPSLPLTVAMTADYDTTGSTVP